MDIVFVKDLQFKTIVGCWDWERQMPQIVSFDLEMGWDNKPAAASEKLGDALNYKNVSKSVETFVQEKEFELVETAAESVADFVMKEFSVPWIKVTLRKPHAVTGSAAVGVVIERGEHG